METGTRTRISLSDAVAKEIRIMLIRHDLKQSDLAARMQKSEMWVSRRVRGAQPIDLNDLQLFADALSVEAADLLAAARMSAVVSSPTGHRQTTGPNLELPVRPPMSGPMKRATPPASSRRPARLVPVIAELIPDTPMELLSA